MPLVFQANTLLMHGAWSAIAIRSRFSAPKIRFFNMDWKAPDNQAEIGAELRKSYNLRTTAELTSCSTCHR